jgi:hypothetical protein
MSLSFGTFVMFAGAIGLGSVVQHWGSARERQRKTMRATLDAARVATIADASPGEVVALRGKVTATDDMLVRARCSDRRVVFTRSDLLRVTVRTGLGSSTTWWPAGIVEQSGIACLLQDDHDEPIFVDLAGAHLVPTSGAREYENPSSPGALALIDRFVDADAPRDRRDVLVAESCIEPGDSVWVVGCVAADAADVASPTYRSSGKTRGTLRGGLEPEAPLVLSLAPLDETRRALARQSWPVILVLIASLACIVGGVFAMLL